MLQSWFYTLSKCHDSAAVQLVCDFIILHAHVCICISNVKLSEYNRSWSLHWSFCTERDSDGKDFTELFSLETVITRKCSRRKDFWEIKNK